MARRISRPLFSAFALSAALVLGWSPTVGAQSDASATREQQAAQLRVAVERRISALDDEYAERAGELRAQFDARIRELEEETESEFVMSNAMAPISRVYQDSLAALQREINARKDSAYAAQNQANNELNRQGEISPETWARVSTTPLNEYPIIPLPTPAEQDVAASVEPEATAEPEVAATIEPEAAAELVPPPAEPAAAPQPVASGCQARWYPDRDRDLFGDAAATPALACYPDKPAGFVDNDYDCDDTDPTVNPITGHCAPE